LDSSFDLGTGTTFTEALPTWEHLLWTPVPQTEMTRRLKRNFATSAVFAAKFSYRDRTNHIDVSFQ
jgi:hypothetical protein